MKMKYIGSKRATNGKESLNVKYCSRKKRLPSKRCLALAAISIIVLYFFVPQTLVAEQTLIYKIKPGDTLYRLSGRFGTSVESILELNTGIDPYTLPRNASIRIAPSAEIQTHRIKPGETLYGIASEYGLRIADISARNMLENPNRILAGDILVIPRAKPVTLYFIREINNGFYLVSEIHNVNAEGNIYANTLKELIRGPLHPGAFSALPTTVTVRDVRIKHGIAYPDFSGEIYRANVGSEAEFLTLAAIANTLTGFQEIKGVYPLVNGKPMGSLGGHILIEEPLTRDESIIYPPTTN